MQGLAVLRPTRSGTAARTRIGHSSFQPTCGGRLPERGFRAEPCKLAIRPDALVAAGAPQLLQDTQICYYLGARVGGSGGTLSLGGRRHHPLILVFPPHS